MPIKNSYTSLDELPDISIKDLYEQAPNGTYRLKQIQGLIPQSEYEKTSLDLVKARDDFKGLKAKINSTIGEKDFTEVASLLNKIPQLEAAASGKVDDSLISSMVNDEVKRKTAAYERDLADLKAAKEQQEKLIGQYKDRERSNIIKNAITEQAVTMNARKTALKDIVEIGSLYLDIDETGRVISKTGLPLDRWMKDQQDERPHWWHETIGGGATGVNTTVSGKNPYATNNLTEQLEFELNNTPEKVAAMKAAAGKK